MRAWVAGLIGLVLCGVACASPPLTAYSRLPALDSPSLSPSGARLAMISVVAGERAVVVREIGGKVLMAMPIGAVKLRALNWAGEDHLLVTVSRWQYLAGTVTPSEYASAVSMNLATGKVVGILS